MIRLSALVLVSASAAAVSQDDAGVVGALDIQYQAAVKAHDVATRNRILAEDSILVTGRGRVFTKADLLQSARDTAAGWKYVLGQAS
jgi:uncharacterized protein DUF4440